MDKKKLDYKYIKLLLERCLDFKKSKILFINYNKEIRDFVLKIKEYALDMGIKEVYLDEDDPEKIKNILTNSTIFEIENCSLFNKSIWDDYAKKNASFLMLETENPGLMDDVDAEKIAKASFCKRATRPIFREKEAKNEISWCIAAYPGQSWAKSIFPSDENAYDKLYMTICKMCMVDTPDPVISWDNYMKESQTIVDKLNSLGILKLHYTNSLGTDLSVTLPKDHIWVGIGDNKDMIFNMPSYEIFTSPDYRYTEGLVYSSRPLVYNGALVEKFYLEFKEGKVVSYEAKKGKEIIKGIVEGDSNSSFLGEVSLINNNSPISNTGLIYGTTLFDENASCHLALGDSFPECIKNGLNLSKQELLNKGLNDSKNHVDFMIGTSDLNIVAETKNGCVQIFKDGNFCI